MPTIRALVIEDESAIARLIQITLEQAGMEVDCTDSVENAKPLLNRQLPDIVLIDWMLPGQSGIQFTKQLRSDSRTQDLPIILLTARCEESDKEQGLNLGADDYVTKPFSPRELVARINALLRRRAPQKTAQQVSIQGLTIDPAQQRVTGNGQNIAFGPTEFKLLHFFMTHTDRIYSRRQLLDQIWGDHIFVEERTVDVHIRRLRRGLETVGLEHLIQTIRGSGSRFSANPDD